MERAIKELSISQVSAPIPIEGKVYVFKLTWKRPVLSPSKAQIKARLESQIRKTKLKKEFELWLKEKEKFFRIKKFPA